MTVYIIPTCGMEATICRGCQTPIRFRKGKRRANDYTVARRRRTRWIPTILLAIMRRRLWILATLLVSD